LEEHLPFCLRNQPQHLKMPKEKDYEFRNWAKTLSPSFVVYADIECLLEAGETNGVLQRHKPIAAAFLIVPHSSLTHMQPTYHSFVGATCIPQFLEGLEKEVNSIGEWNDRHAHKVMKPLAIEQQQRHESATVCCMCKKSFSKEQAKVKDHCHLTGEYRGPTCQPCNTKARLRRNTTPVLFHNWKGYDAHHIVREGVRTRPHWELDVIATTSESYLNLRASWGGKQERRQINFIDSLQFLQASLAKLVSMCRSLPLTDSLPWPAAISHAKGVFPYSYFDKDEKMTDTSLPPIDAFHDALTNTPLSEEDYRRAQDAWNAMGCLTFGDYMMSKLMTNLLL
jgi:hypothetical protein